jgi:ABC-type multidrug transport system permease subunit
MALMFPLMMLGGSFFPFEAMPEWMATIGAKTPNGWALDRLKDIVFERSDASVIAIAFILLTVITALLLIVSAIRLRRVFAQG